jgi:hypothetical protein
MLLGAFFDVTNPTKVRAVALLGSPPETTTLGWRRMEESTTGNALLDFDTRTDFGGLASMFVAASAVGTSERVSGPRSTLKRRCGGNRQRHEATSDRASGGSPQRNPRRDGAASAAVNRHGDREPRPPGSQLAGLWEASCNSRRLRESREP